ncbi:50S ribosomal protein L4, partial [Candidatus Micrarchaeota archaeon]|nr:50S ribosomal protein L4 [Candidatus Micrarchaeota archaeon]
LSMELEKLGLADDLSRAKEGRQKRSGKSRLRKGGYIVPKSVLIVAGEDKGIWKACRNIPGVDFSKVGELNIELLAPGGQAGRLTVWTQDALDKMEKEQLYL